MVKTMMSVATPAVQLVAICGKCGKKLGGGFGPKGGDSLGRALTRLLDLPKPKRARVRIVETKCLKLCPKGAVAVMAGSTPGAILVVPEGTPTMMVVERLGIG